MFSPIDAQKKAVALKLWGPYEFWQAFHRMAQSSADVQVIQEKGQNKTLQLLFDVFLYR